MSRCTKSFSKFLDSSDSACLLLDTQHSTDDNSRCSRPWPLVRDHWLLTPDPRPYFRYLSLLHHPLFFQIGRWYHCAANTEKSKAKPNFSAQQPVRGQGIWVSCTRDTWKSHNHQLDHRNKLAGMPHKLNSKLSCKQKCMASCQATQKPFI